MDLKQEEEKEEEGEEEDGCVNTQVIAVQWVIPNFTSDHQQRAVRDTAGSTLRLAAASITFSPLGNGGEPVCLSVCLSVCLRENNGELQW